MLQYQAIARAVVFDPQIYPQMSAGYWRLGPDKLGLVALDLCCNV
jgi:hypothetical protein